MQCKIKAKILKDAIKAVSALVEEATFNASDNGISLKAMDASQIAMVSMEIPKNAFIEYPLTIDEKFCIDIKRLLEVLSRTKDETVEIETGTQMTLRFIGEGRKRTFNIPLLETGGNTRKEPTVIHDSFIEVEAGLLDTLIKDSQLAGDHITFEADTSFKVSSKTEINEFLAEYEPSDTVKLGGKAKAMFPAKFISDMVKAAENETKVKLNMASDKPMKLEYALDEVKVAYWIAPRIDSE